MVRSARLAVIASILMTVGLLPTVPAGASPADAVNDGAGYAAARSVTSFISVVDRSTGAVLGQTGNAHAQVASESIMKLLLASYYLVLYGGPDATPDSVKTRLSYMLRVSDDATASSLFSANAIPTIAARYGMSNTTNATDRAGHWGAARITAADMTQFLFRASQDAAVGPWLLPVMAQTDRFGSDGFDQGFGLNALSGDHGSKQGWGCDSFWTAPSCAIHSVGYTSRSFVAVLQLSDGYPDPMRQTATYAAQVIQQSTSKPDPIGAVDVVGNPAQNVLTIAGWAADPAAPGQQEEVHVYVTGPAGTKGYPGNYTTGARSDVLGAYPWAGPSTGFSATMSAQGEGLNTVCVYALNVSPPNTNPSIGCRSALVRNAFGRLDLVGTTTDQIVAAGWALNPNNPGENVEIHVYDNGPAGTRGYPGFRAGTSRPDVAAAYSSYGTGHGYVSSIPSLAVGNHNVCAYAITTAGGAGNTLLGCQNVLVRNAFGTLDLVGARAGNVVAAGWALNPNTPGENVEIHVYDTSASGTRSYPGFWANQPRSDVGAAYPGYGDNHGYWAEVPAVGPGLHSVCTYAITTGGGAGNTLLGCRSYTVAG